MRTIGLKIQLCDARLHGIVFMVMFNWISDLQQLRAIRCYCTEEVGLLRSSNAVVRTCGNEEVGCQHNTDKWLEMCSCEESFCNTFSYLRASISRNRIEATRSSDIDVEEDQRIFQRVDGFDDLSSYSTMQEDEKITKKSTLLTLMLVIVPLSVGAATVLVVAFNYYCHLC